MALNALHCLDRLIHGVFYARILRFLYVYGTFLPKHTCILSLI